MKNIKSSRFKHNPLKNRRGFAVIESLTMIIIFLTLFWYTIGFWGVIHTGTLQAISSRNYAFEVIRHRSNLWYFRENDPNLTLKYHKVNVRLHGTNSEMATDSKQYATERRVAMFHEADPEGRNAAEHARAIGEVQTGQRNASISLDPVWIKIQYGLCLTAGCGGQ